MGDSRSVDTREHLVCSVGRGHKEYLVLMRNAEHPKENVDDFIASVANDYFFSRKLQHRFELLFQKCMLRIGIPVQTPPSGEVAPILIRIEKDFGIAGELIPS